DRRIGHDRGRIGVDQDDAEALLTQDLARLGAGVVELAGLPDHDRARAQHQDRVEIVTQWHGAPRTAQAASWTSSVSRRSRAGSGDALGETLEQVARVG